MRKFDKKEAWENAEVVYWRDNAKYRETLQHFFSKRPVYYFHKTMKYMGIVIAFNQIYTDSEMQLPKDCVTFSCTSLYWKSVKKLIKWGLKHDPEVEMEMVKNERKLAHYR